MWLHVLKSIKQLLTQVFLDKAKILMVAIDG